MATIKIEIKNGKAVELNPFGVEPNYWDFDKYPPVFELDARRDAEENSRRDAMIREDWEKAEAARKVYEIEVKTQKYSSHACVDKIIPPNGMCGGSDSEYYTVTYKENSIHDAELINETTVRLV